MPGAHLSSGCACSGQADAVGGEVVQRGVLHVLQQRIHRALRHARPGLLGFCMCLSSAIHSALQRTGPMCCAEPACLATHSS